MLGVSIEGSDVAVVYVFLPEFDAFDGRVDFVILDDVYLDLVFDWVLLLQLPLALLLQLPQLVPQLLNFQCFLVTNLVLFLDLGLYIL